jgi:hypothetical protein
MCKPLFQINRSWILYPPCFVKPREFPCQSRRQKHFEYHAILRNHGDKWGNWNRQIPFNRLHKRLHAIAPIKEAIGGSPAGQFLADLPQRSIPVVWPIFMEIHLILCGKELAVVYSLQKNYNFL